MPGFNSNPHIHVSGGQSSPPDLAILFPSGQIPSGQPGSNLAAALIIANATFGFNVTPHTLDTEWVPYGSTMFHGASGQLPSIGTFLEIFIGQFYFRGRTIHSDYKSNEGGTIVRITLEDDRKRIDNLKIHTEDLGTIPSGIASAAGAFRELHGFRNEDGSVNDTNAIEYNNILTDGATYTQILEAINLAFVQGRTFVSTSQLPTVEQLETNILANIGSIRWQFNMSPLSEAITTILQDTGYDWYWNMNTNRVQLINKKLTFTLQESDILNLVSEFGSVSGLNETQNITFGKDAIEEPTKIRLLGGHQQGFINSRLLSPLDGLDTTALDGHVVFTPAWPNLRVGFYDSQGFYRVYLPSEKELQLALAGIEQWSYFKKYQTNLPTDTIPGYSLPADAGFIAAQHLTFQSRLDPLMPLADIASEDNTQTVRVIANRRDEEHNWTLDFYQRILNHAQRHYGRSYVASGVLFSDTSGQFTLVDSAWSNVENQIDGQSIGPSGSSGPFTSTYRINRQLGPISPFVSEDFKVSAHCVLPSNTVYGSQGDDVPASFGNWTEDAPPFNPSGDGSHYIPVSLTLVGHRVIDPHSDELYSFEKYPEGTIWCQLPVIVGSGIFQDGVLQNLATLIELSATAQGSGLIDINLPATIVTPFSLLSGVAIPIEAPIRYGQVFPNPFTQGTLHPQRGETTIVDDSYVPWNFFPVGDQTSVNIMARRAVGTIRGRIVSGTESTYADFLQVGLPLIGFDSFSQQDTDPNGSYGTRSHGVTELNISFSIEGFMTRYKIASYFPQYGRDAPLGEKSRGLLDGILHPIDFANLDLLNNIPGPPPSPLLPGAPGIAPLFIKNKKEAVKVTITEVNQVFTIGFCTTPASGPVQERYRGKTRGGTGAIRPDVFTFSSNPDFQIDGGAICVDGFLNIGDEAIYHNDEFDLPNGRIVLRYFTGGRPLGNATVVEVVQANPNNSDTFDVEIVSNALPAGRAICNLSPLVEGSLVSVGGRMSLAGAADASVKPGNATNGLFLQSTSAGVVPIIITDVLNQGTTSALATANELNSEGEIAVGGRTFSDCLVIPFRQFTVVGDKGILISTSAPNASVVPEDPATLPINFVLIPRQSFIRFVS